LCTYENFVILGIAKKGMISMGTKIFNGLPTKLKNVQNFKKKEEI
jgi:hypothetical protein